MDFKQNKMFISKSKKLSGKAMLAILFVLFIFVIGIAVGSTYSAFQSTSTSNGTLSFAVNGHQGIINLNHTKISAYNSQDLVLTFTLGSDIGYGNPNITGITMGGTPLTQENNNFKNGSNIVATYNSPILTINRAHVLGDMEITGSSTEQIYTITYNATTNGGATSATTADLTYGDSADLTKTASKTGWTFIGWNTSSNATIALASYTVTADTTLYAIFSRILTIWYNNNGITGSVNATIYNTATSGTSSSNFPTIAGRSGWTPYGWSSSIEANNSRVDTNTSTHAITINTTNSGSTYYATYSRTLTLSYNANGGSSTPSSQTTTQYYNSAGNTSSHSFTLASAISKTATAQYSYSFNSWGWGSASGTSYNAGASVTLSENTTFYAKWNSAIRYYTVSGFNDNKVYAYGTVLTIAVSGVQASRIMYELKDANGNQIDTFGPLNFSQIGTCYVNGTRIAGLGDPVSGDFTVTGDCVVTFGPY